MDIQSKTNIQNKHIVLFRLSALGDIVLTTGLIDYLSKEFACTFSVITKDIFSPVFENNPAVTEIIALNKNDLANFNFTAQKLAKEYSNNILLDLHSNLRSKILSFFWQNKVYTYPKYKLSRMIYLYTKNKTAQTQLLEHNVPERYSLALFSKKISKESLIPKIYLNTPKNEEHYIILHPYASYEPKNWLQNSWQELVDCLEKEQINFKIVGKGKSFLKLVKPENDLTNTTNLTQMFEIINSAKLVISSDSGPMHIAAALNTSVIGIFCPTSAEWGFYPFNTNSYIFSNECACKPCSLHGQRVCNKDFECYKISVNSIFNKIKNILA